MTDTLAQIERALDANDLQTAAALAEQALVAGSRAPLVFNLVAWKKEDEGQFEEAEDILHQALKLAPEDPSLYLALGTVIRSQGRLKAAVAALERAVELEPGYAAAWYERGATFEKGGAIDDAIADYRHALTLEPHNPAALSALAAALARRGELNEAAGIANQALRLDPGNIQALNALAQTAIEQQRFDDAIALLIGTTGDDDDRREAMIATRTLLGDALEGAGRYAEAYASYVRAQSLFQTINAARTSADREDAQTTVEKIAVSFANANPAAWTGTEGIVSGAATHVFLTGYPRSGTTLAENILATLPNSVAIEERPTLADVDRSYSVDPDGHARLAGLSEDALDVMRKAYWHRAEEAAGEALAGKLFIDMDPFKGVRLPLIARLFPSAKIVIMQRDPRDVVWSCFHTSFAYNAGTMGFSTLEGTARHYSKTWEIIKGVVATLPIDHFTLRYDTLVRDFDATTLSLCDFLGVKWEESLRRFDRTAQRRGVSTASLTQVRRGLYDGSGGWRRYAEQLATVEPILRPWIEKFGYLDA
jgi:tetratricopeptide (TPR) repeat protein